MIFLFGLYRIMCTIILSYTYMFGNENTIGGGMFSSVRNKSGDLYTAKVAHKFSKSIHGYLLIEDFVPGDFYANGNRKASIGILTSPSASGTFFIPYKLLVLMGGSRRARRLKR